MKKTWAFIPLCLAGLLASCNGTNTSDQGGLSSKPDEPVCPESSLDDLSDINFDLGISGEGKLNDFALGFPAIVGQENLIAFSFSNADIATAVVKTDVPCVATAEKKGDRWYVTGHNPGRTHLIIEDGEGIVHYRAILNVAKELTPEEAKSRLYTVDHWKVKPGFELFNGNFTVAFMEDLSATMAGVESGGVNLSGATFNVTLDNTLAIGPYNEQEWFGFSVQNWKVADFNLASVMLHKSGAYMHMHTNNSLLGIMVPGEAK